MNRKTILTFLLLISSWCNAQLKYPVAPRKELTDTIFNTIVNDPFHSLEYFKNDEVNDWLNKQWELTCQYRKTDLRDYDNIRERISEFSIYYTPSFTKKGKYYYRYIINSEFSNSSLYLARTPNDTYKMIVNPSWFQQRGENLTISDFYVSKDNRYLAVALSNSGSDWNQVRIQTLASGKFFDDVITGINNDDIAWKDDGFYYWRYEMVGVDELGYRLWDNRQLYYHKLGTPQAQDSLSLPGLSLSGSLQVTQDEKYMLLKTTQKETDSLAWTIIDLDSKKQFVVSDSLLNPKSKYQIRHHANNNIFLSTTDNAVNGKVVVFNVSDQTINTIVREFEDVLEDVQIINDHIVCQYYRDGKSGIVIYDKLGKEVLAKQFPTGQIAELTHDDQMPGLILKAFNFPKVVYQIDIAKTRLDLVEQTKIRHESGDYTTKYVKYPSKDGTMIPMFITYKKGIELGSTNNPVLLYGYGGYGISTKPYFDPSHIVFMESGGVLAVPQIRGGGEFGEEWHKAGKALNKQNTFDDFIAAAEYLIKIRLTNPDKIAINGASHGGLLVGASMTQRPDLFKTAIPEVGVFDMIGILKQEPAQHKEYGSIKIENEFRNILSYSPIHNLKPQTNYPATLIMTSDSDDRVPPEQSYKFTARLQEIMPIDKPCLLYLNQKAGHSGATNFNDHLDYEAMKYSFIFKQLGMSAK